MDIKRPLYQVRPGISMLIAIGLITVIMFFSLIASNVVISSIRLSVNSNHGNYAYYAAEGALEAGLMENAEKAAGYSGTLNDIDYVGGAVGSVKIQGSVPDDRKYNGGGYDDMYGIPTPGTGDAGAECDPLKAPYESAMTYWYSATDEPNYVYAASDPGGEDYINFDDAADHPCNWNKIGVGDVVSIPLYTTASDGTVSNPEDLGISSLMIRLRTACDGGDEMCLGSGRLALDDAFGDDFYKCDADTLSNCGDTVVSWEIKGESIDGEEMYVLGANRKADDFGERNSSVNSELYEFKINMARITPVGSCSDIFCMLTDANKGEDLDETLGLIGDFLLNTSTFARSGDDRINKPVLKLSVIHSLRDKHNNNDPVPFLEYQVLMDATTAPADSSQIITAEGMSGTFKFTVEAKVPQGGGVLDYVIQQ